MDTEAQAQGFLRVSQAKSPAFFTEVPAAIVPVRYAGGRVYYRVVAGGYASRAAAAAACRKVKEEDPAAFCKVVAN
jgi:septal ring-binding cell division protein DamX